MKKILLALVLLTAGVAAAGPAPWWLWENASGTHKVCSQTPLGPGWHKLLGPYKDSHCEKLIRAQ